MLNMENLIANQLIQRMFMRIANRPQRFISRKLSAIPVRGHGLATAYASKLVYAKFSEIYPEPEIQEIPANQLSFINLLKN